MGRLPGLGPRQTIESFTMRLIFLALLVMCAALCCVIAYTAWQAGGPGIFEVLTCVGAVGVLGWLLPIVWRESGPVHEPESLPGRVAVSGVSFPADSVDLREMPADERERITDAA